jgi:hypothetical protein
MTQLALGSHPRPARIARASRRRVSISLWLPLTPILALLSPLVLVGAPLAWMTRAGRRVSPVRLAWTIGALLTSLSGTVIAVDAPGARIRIRIF